LTRVCYQASLFAIFALFAIQVPALALSFVSLLGLQCFGSALEVVGIIAVRVGRALLLLDLLARLVVLGRTIKPRLARRVRVAGNVLVNVFIPLAETTVALPHALGAACGGRRAPRQADLVFVAA